MAEFASQRLEYVLLALHACDCVLVGQAIAINRWGG